MGENGFTVAELSVETGSLGGTRFLLDRPLVAIGRADDNDIRLEDDMVSKNHCRIITQGDNYLIEDLGSSNGTIVNGRQVNTYMLQDGDKLFLGDTTLQFRKAASAPAPVAGEATAAGKKKWIWVTVGILGGLILVAAAVVLVLIFVVLPERDSVKPTVTISQPTAGQSFELNMPVTEGVPVRLSVRASDNKGLDRVDFIASGPNMPAVPYKTVKATVSTRKSNNKVKEETFNITIEKAREGDYQLRAKAYDWKGNVAETDPISFKVKPSGSVDAANAFCRTVDGYVTEYNANKSTFGGAYSKLSSNAVTMADATDAGAVFSKVLDERKSLRSRLDSLDAQPEFAESLSQFKQTVDYAITADEAAIQWANAVYWDQYNKTYPTSYYYYTPITTDPSVYKNQVDGASGSATSEAASFTSVYDHQRVTLLGIEHPGPLN